MIIGEGGKRPRLLIVEDDFVQIAFLEEMLAEIGALVVAAAGNLSAGLQAAESEDLDAAFLDVNLGGKRSCFLIADALRRRRIPFAFSTGYSGTALPASYRDVPILAKPFDMGELEQALQALLQEKALQESGKS